MRDWHILENLNILYTFVSVNEYTFLYTNNFVRIQTISMSKKTTKEFVYARICTYTGWSYTNIIARIQTNTQNQDHIPAHPGGITYKNVAGSPRYSD